MDPAVRPGFAPVLRRWLVWPALIALALVAMDYTTDFDRTVTRLVFDANADVFPLRNDFWVEIVMHHWAKYAVVTLGALVIGSILLSYVLPGFAAQRPILLFLAVSLVVAPLSVSLGKALSAKHCPWDIDEFGGLVPYTRNFERTPPSVPPGHCFPAGHASTGFALMAFYFAAHAKRRRNAARAALAIAVFAGLALGWGRVLQGAHFVSHVFWSGVVCWLVLVGLYALILRGVTAKRVMSMLCAVLAIGLAGCDRGVEKTEAPKAEKGVIGLSEPGQKYLTIETVSASEPASTYGPIPGRIALKPEAVQSLGAPTAGRIASVLVRPGETVPSGKPLLTLQSADAAGARATLEQAHARASAAEENLKRQNEMIAKGVGLEFERFEAETRAREARAELDRARRASSLLGGGQGDYVTLRAPAAGVVMTVKATVGAMVAPGGEALVEVGDASKLWAVADVPESDTALISKGQVASISIPSAGRLLDGSVDGLGSRIDPETRRLPIYIALKGNLLGLAPGMYAELRFTTRTQGITVPVSAVLIKEGKRRVVYVQRADGRFELRDVRVGGVSAGRVPVLEGLQAGERIVVKGGLLLDTAAEQLL